MADFDVAMRIVSKNEGGYNNDPRDKGGETYRGVARKYHPTWEGWEIIDAYKDATSFPEVLDEVVELQKLVLSFYKTNFWNQMRCGNIDNQLLANKIFDLGVNLGCGKIIKIVQRLIHVAVDGVVGAVTIAAINNREAMTLLNEIKEAAKEYYLSRNRPEYIKGWLARLNRD